MSAVDPKIFFDMLAAAGRHSAASYIDQIAVPALVVSGECDHFTPAHLSAKMAARIPNAEALVVEEGTHATPVEYPTLVNYHIENFIARNEQAAKGEAPAETPAEAEKPAAASED